MTIIRGTTPTIKYTFQVIAGTDLTAAVMTVSQNGEVLIEKDLTAGFADETSVSWVLSQTDTLKLDVDFPAKITLNWKIADGTRGASKVTIASVEDNDVSEVI